MDKLEHLYQANIALLSQLNVEYNQWQHEPILDFETDVIVAKRLGWTATHTKSLFLKLKGGGHALFLTEKDTRLDGKALKALLGKRPSICDDQQMSEITGCVAGAVCPFTLPQDVPIVVDSRLHQEDEILYTPARPDITFSIKGTDLKTVLNSLPNPIHEL